MTKKQTTDHAASITALAESYVWASEGTTGPLYAALQDAAASLLLGVNDIKAAGNLIDDDGADYISEDQMTRRVDGVELVAVGESVHEGCCSGCYWDKNNMPTCDEANIICCCAGIFRKDKTEKVWQKASEVTQ
jgi:hypothetical protein